MTARVFFFFFFFSGFCFCFGLKLNWFTKKCFCKLRSSEAPADADGIHTSKVWRRYRPCSDLHTEVRFSPPPSRNQPFSLVQHAALHVLTLICLIGIPHWCSGVFTSAHCSDAHVPNTTNRYNTVQERDHLKFLPPGRDAAAVHSEAPAAVELLCFFSSCTRWSHGCFFF